MYAYGKKSKSRLMTCDSRLQDVFLEAIEHMDISILEGFRTERRQNDLFDQGKSQLKWPEGKHNTNPSLAIDAAPYPIDWKDRERATLFAGFILGMAANQGIELRWGGD